MPISDEYRRVSVDIIKVDRERRQRQRELDVSDLVPSVIRNGVIHPIVVERDFTLVAGERRLLASIEARVPLIPIRFADELTPSERIAIELEENIKRKNLAWQDEYLAAKKLHEVYCEIEPDWSVGKTAAAIGMSERHLYRYVHLAKELEAGDEAISAADTAAAAWTIYERRNNRAQAEQINQLVEDITSGQPAAAPQQAAGPSSSALGAAQAAAAALPPLNFNIFHSDFFEWSAAYSGPKFNFIHVDFPYGVELNEQAGQDAFEGGGYESTPEIYDKLCAALCANWQRIALSSCHLMFWISMEFYTDTVTALEAGVPGLRLFRTPLVWMKSDNRGIMADAKRQPRRIYEAALFGSTGDRFLVRPKSNAYACPTNKSDAIHTNEKPQPMLRHFFEMFVDEHTRILDPTCGSGNAITVAEELGAEAGLGLEFNPEFAERAARRLVQSRNLRALSEKAHASRGTDARASGPGDEVERPAGSGQDPVGSGGRPADGTSESL